MRKHRSFSLPESEQASRQARQEPDGMTVGREMEVFPALAPTADDGTTATTGRGLSDGVEAEGLEP